MATVSVSVVATDAHAQTTGSPAAGSAVVPITPLTTPAGQSVPMRLVYLRSQSAQACPNQQIIEQRVADFLGRPPFAPMAARSVVVAVQKADQWKAQIQLVDEEGVLLGERLLQSNKESCDDIANLLVLTLSMAIDHNVKIPVKPTTPTTTPATTPPTATPPTTTPANPNTGKPTVLNPFTPTLPTAPAGTGDKKPEPKFEIIDDPQPTAPPPPGDPPPSLTDTSPTIVNGDPDLLPPLDPNDAHTDTALQPKANTNTNPHTNPDNTTTNPTNPTNPTDTTHNPDAILPSSEELMKDLHNDSPSLFNPIPSPKVAFESKNYYHAGMLVGSSIAPSNGSLRPGFVGGYDMNFDAFLLGFEARVDMPAFTQAPDQSFVFNVPVVVSTVPCFYESGVGLCALLQTGFSTGVGSALANGGAVEPYVGFGARVLWDWLFDDAWGVRLWADASLTAADAALSSTLKADPFQFAFGFAPIWRAP